MDVAFYATKIIRSESFGISYGIDTTPHRTIEEALVHAREMAHDQMEFDRDWTVRMERDDSSSVSIPECVLDFLKKVIG